MTYNTPVRHLQMGSQLTVATSGTIVLHTGGSMQVESGAVIQIAAGGSLVNAGGIALGAGVTLTNPTINVITLGGTTGKWAFGTVGLTSAVGTIGLPGFTRVLSATGNVIAGEASGAGSTTSVQIDLSLAAAGSIIFHTSIGTLPAVVNGTVAWLAFGT